MIARRIQKACILFRATVILRRNFLRTISITFKSLKLIFSDLLYNYVSKVK